MTRSRWPSAFGPTDQAGATKYITPAKVLKAVQLVKTGQMYELGHIYQASMPQFGSRPYYIGVVPAGRPQREGAGSALARQNIREDSIEPGDAILFNDGWAVNWTSPSKYNDGR